ncbi:hypothetical protein EJ04DRAFT_80761 [Polyplosphaeria fusca]|uniref:Zn(2)-C6 fungal-type domain-containing protein n=1 Tax=Polyplosphaeria fusca TaxID=682080 RepID=A0A9P4R6M8_9PLEO|nr:hypothetical protein EJ04DRAFT_80761 [Polyplosphaeria fusca]
MESRGNRRQSVNRRSCDRCRFRKIGCDRSSPCSNCVAVKLGCTYSAVTSNATTPKQRVLISAQYEQKIDEIANGVGSIKLLLQNSRSEPTATAHTPASSNNDQLTPKLHSEHVWDHSTEVLKFVKAVVRDSELGLGISPENDAVKALRQIIGTLDGSNSQTKLPCPKVNILRPHSDLLLLPSDAVLVVLRWAKEHTAYMRMEWISRILPLEKFTEICRNVCFPVSDYTEIDFILANGYLSHVFAEYMIVSGASGYRQYYDLCRTAFHTAVSRLPLLLPMTMEAIAALALGAFGAIENSHGMLAWNLLSVASNYCQTLGYHRSPPTIMEEQSEHAAHSSLFWAVYIMEKGLSLRLGRPSHLRDEEITLSFDSGPRDVRASRIQGKVYEQLYSPFGLSLREAERARIAQSLVEELQGIINEADTELEALMPSEDLNVDPMRALYLRCHLLCHYSLLALLLRAIPPTQGTLSGVSDDCVNVARHCLKIHTECMRSICNSDSHSLLVAQYINWPVLHMPFVPFIILVTNSVQNADFNDLSMLEGFVESLKPPEASSEASSEAPTHPYRLYGLLCKIARQLIDSNTYSTLADPTLSDDLFAQLSDVDFSAYFGTAVNQSLEDEGSQMTGLGEWFRNSQQMMSLLDGDTGI